MCWWRAKYYCPHCKIPLKDADEIYKHLDSVHIRQTRLNPRIYSMIETEIFRSFRWWGYKRT